MLWSEIIGRCYIISWDRPRSYDNMEKSLSSLGRFASVATKTSGILFPKIKNYYNIIRRTVTRNLDRRVGRAFIAHVALGAVSHIDYRDPTPRWRRRSEHRFIISWDNASPSTSVTLIASLETAGSYYPISTQTTGTFVPDKPMRRQTLFSLITPHLNTSKLYPGRAVVGDMKFHQAWSVNRLHSSRWCRIY